MTDYRERCADAAMKAWGEQAVLCDHSQIIPIGSVVDAVLGVRDGELEQLKDDALGVVAHAAQEVARLRVQREAARASRDETHLWTNTDWKERAEQARAEAAELRAELERRITADAEALADQTLLKGITVEDGAVNLDLIPPREIAAIWVHCAIGMLGEAPNYSETEVKMPTVSMEISPAGTFDRYALIVQRVGKLTPHEARQEAEARADAADAAIARARADCEAQKEYHRRHVASNTTRGGIYAQAARTLNIIDARVPADQAAQAPALPLWRASERARLAEGVGKAAWVEQIGIGRRSYDRLTLQKNPPIATTVRKIAERIGTPINDAMRLAGLLTEPT